MSVSVIAESNNEKKRKPNARIDTFTFVDN